MNRKVLIEDTIEKIQQLPDTKIQQLNDFVDFLLSRIDDKLLIEGIQKLTSESKSFKYLMDEEDLYSVNDLKDKYK